MTTICTSDTVRYTSFLLPFGICAATNSQQTSLKNQYFNRPLLRVRKLPSLFLLLWRLASFSRRVQHDCNGSWMQRNRYSSGKKRTPRSGTFQKTSAARGSFFLAVLTAFGNFGKNICHKLCPLTFRPFQRTSHSKRILYNFWNIIVKKNLFDKFCTPCSWEFNLSNRFWITNVSKNKKRFPREKKHSIQNCRFMTRCTVRGSGGLRIKVTIGDPSCQLLFKIISGVPGEIQAS